MGIEEALEVLKEYHEDIDAGLEPTGRNLGMYVGLRWIYFLTLLGEEKMRKTYNRANRLYMSLRLSFLSYK